MTNRLWVTLHILWKAASSHLSLWPIGSEWHCTFCERQSHHIFSYDLQRVSDIAHFVKGISITSFPMTNRKWVTLHMQSHHIFSYDQQRVSDIAHFVKGSLITSFPMTNSGCKWHFAHLWKAVSWHLLLWPTASECCCTFCERQPHHIFSYDQQQVSDIAHFVKGSLITSFLWQTGSEWHCTFCERQSHISTYDQQEVSDIAHSVKGISSHLFLWLTACEWHCIFCKRLSHHIFPLTNSKWVLLQFFSPAFSA